MNGRSFQMAYTDRFGRANPASYWYCPNVVFDADEGYAAAVYRGYTDAAACAAGADPLGSHTVRINGADFAAAVMATWYGTQPLGEVVTALAAADPFFAGAEVV